MLRYKSIFFYIIIIISKSYFILKGLSTENLKMAVWKGEIEFHNLQIKKAVLTKLELPFKLNLASVKSLRAVIPWTNIGTHPLKIIIDGIYCNIEAEDISQYTAEDLKKQTELLKKKILEKVEKLSAIDARNDSGDESKIPNDNKNTNNLSLATESKTYLQRLVSKIIANIEIQICNVHIRYEDSISVSGSLISAGLTLNELKLIATDSIWEELSLKTVTALNDTNFYKLATLKNLGVYWNVHCKKLGDLDKDEQEKQIQSLIFTDDNRCSNNYILCPPNLSSIKITHTGYEEKDFNIPKLDMKMNLSLPLEIDRLQLHQLCAVLDMVTIRQRKRYLFLMRPHKRPNEDPRAWWIYTYSLLTGKEDAIFNREKSRQLCLMNKDRYKMLAKKQFLYSEYISKQSLEKKSGYFTSKENIVHELTNSENEEFNKIEAMLPLQALIVLRQAAVREIIIGDVISRKRKEAGENGVKDKKGFFASCFSLFSCGTRSNSNHSNFSKQRSIINIRDKVKESDDEDLSIDAIRQDFEGDLLLNKDLDVDIFLLRLTLSLESSIKVISDSIPVADINFSFDFTSSFRSSNNINAQLKFYDLEIIDRLTNAPGNTLWLGFPSKVSYDSSKIQSFSDIKNSSDKTNFIDASIKSNGDTSFDKISLDYEVTNGKSSVKVNISPLEIILHPTCVCKLMDILILPSIHLSFFTRSAQVSDYVLRFKNLLRKDDRLQYKVRKQDTTLAMIIGDNMDIHLVAELPKIVVPEGNRAGEDIILGIGKLIFRATCTTQSLTSWKISVTSFNVSMPSPIRESIDYADTNTYLIRPFSVSASARNRDDEGLQVAIGAAPEIRICLSSSKLNRVFTVVNTIISIVDSTKRKVNKCRRNARKYLQYGSVEWDRKLRQREAHFDEYRLTRQVSVDFNSVDGDDFPIDVNEFLRKLASIPFVEPASLSKSSKLDDISDLIMTRVLQQVVLNVPLVTLDAQYYYSKSGRFQLMTLLIVDFYFSFIARDKNSNIKCTVGNISLQDSLRPFSQRYLFDIEKFNPSDDASNNHRQEHCVDLLVTLTQKGEICVLTEIDIMTNKLNLSIDSNSILHTEQYFDVILFFVNCFTTSKFQNDNYALLNVTKSELKRLNKSANKSESYDDYDSDNDVNLFNKFDAILASHDSNDERPRHSNNFWGKRNPNFEAPVLGIIKPKSSKLITVETKTTFRMILQKVDIVILKATDEDEISSGLELDDVYKVSLEDLEISHCEFNHDGNSENPFKTALVTISSLKILDLRKMSKENAFQTLLTNVPYSTFANAPVVRRRTGGISNIVHESSRTASSEPFFQLTYTEGKKGIKVIDVFMSDILMCGSLDAFIDSSNVSVNIAFAITSIISTESKLKRGTVENLWIDKDFNHEKIDELLDLRRNSSSTLTIRMQLPNPYLLILDDPLVESSRSILLRCIVDVHCGVDFWNGHLKETQEFLHASIQGIQLFVISDTQEWIKSTPELKDKPILRQKISNPFSVDFHVTRRLEKGVVLAANISFNMSDIDAVLSIDNIALAQSIISRKTLTGLAPPKITENIRYCIFGARGGVAGTQVDIYVLAANVGCVTLTAIREVDEEVNVKPIIKTKMLSASFQADGALHPRIMVDSISINLEVDVHHVEGIGFLTFEVDFFNPNVSMWEPVLETWKPEITLKKEQLGLVVDIDAKDVMQFNLSGKMIDSVIHAYSVLQRRADEALYRLKNSINSSNNFKIEEINGGVQLQVDTSPRSSASPSTHASKPRSALIEFGSPSSLKILPAIQGSGVVIQNRLLCRADFRIEEKIDNVKAKQEKFKFDKRLAPGEYSVIEELDITKVNIQLAVSLDGEVWSNFRTLSTDRERVKTLDFSTDGVIKFSLSFHSSVKNDHDGVVMEITVFSKNILIDRAGLDLSVRSSRKWKTVERCTFNRSENYVSTDLQNGFKCLKIIRESAGYSPLHLQNFHVNSRRGYALIHALQQGDKVYTDREITWVHLPLLMQKQIFICTSCDDYASKSRDLMKFTLNSMSILIVLVEASCVSNLKAPPEWLVLTGFRRILKNAIARKFVDGQQNDIHYLMYGKLCMKGDEVTLGGAETYGVSGYMYTVSVIDPTTLVSMSDDNIAEILGQIMLDSGKKGSEVQQDWINGGDGICMFHTDDGTNITIGTSKTDTFWSDEIDLKIPKSSKTSFEIVNKATSHAYQLIYTVSPLSGLFHRTQVVTIMPYYCIVNCMDEAIEMRQQDTQQELIVQPFESACWHKADYKKSTKLHLRSESSQWSYGCIDVNEVGSSVFLLPSKDWFVGSSNHNAVVAQVEVKLAEAQERCSVVIVVWKASRETGSAISIKNDSDIPITINQFGIFEEKLKNIKDPVKIAEIEQQEALFNVCVAPGMWAPYGWADPDANAKVIVTIGTPPHGPNKVSKSIALLKLNEISVMDLFPPVVESKDSPKGKKEKKVTIKELSTLKDVEPKELSNLKAVSESTEEGNEVIEDVVLDDETNKVFIAVQSLGSGRVIRIVRHKQDFGTMVRISNDNDEDVVGMSRATTGAIVAGAVVGTLILGPFAGVLLAGGAVYAYSRQQQAVAEKEKNEKEASELIEERARSISAVTPGNVNEIHASQISTITSDFNVALSLRMNAISVSLTVEKPVRREFMSLYLEKIEARVRATVSARSLEVSLGNAQLDTYSETAISPVVMYTIRDAESKDVPLLTFIVVEENQQGSTAHFKYIAARMLEVGINIDSATLQLLVTDLGSDFSFVSREQALALQEPMSWATEFNNSIILPENQLQTVDIFRSQVAAQAKRIYIENLVLHPIKVTLTFQQTSLPRKKDETAMAVYVEYLSYIPTFANVDRATLKLNSFIVSDAMESMQSLTSRIAANSWRDLNYQLAKLAGSLTMLGRPVGLARNIGGGVQAFFYEPYQGAMTSPSSFVRGIGKGASSLVGGVASGLLNSTAAIVSTASQGLSQSIVTMSGDEKFVLKRTDRRRKAQEAAREGVFSGLREGGGSFLSGVKAGLTGVITKPLEGARKQGAIGFVKGLGIGVVGIAVNPVLGITDGLNSVAQTVYYQSSDAETLLPIRQPRTYDIIMLENTDTTDNKIGLFSGLQLLTNLNLKSIDAQVFIKARAKKRGEADAFVGFISLKKDPSSIDSVILTVKYLFWRRLVSYSILESLEKSKGEKARKLLEDVALNPEKGLNANNEKSTRYREVVDTISWKNICHCLVAGEQVVEIMTDTEVILIPCEDKVTAEDLYALLARNANRMKNPNVMLSKLDTDQSKNNLEVDLVADIVSSPNANNDSMVESLTKKRGSQDNALFINGIYLGPRADTYAFGSANNHDNSKDFEIIESSKSSKSKKHQRTSKPPPPKHPNGTLYNGKDIIAEFEEQINQLSIDSELNANTIVGMTNIWKRIDEIMWNTVINWYSIHSGMQASRCCSCAIINGSMWPMQLSRMELKSGKGFKVCGAYNYSADSRTIHPSGILVIFLWGNYPSFMSSGHAKVFIETSVFSAIISTKRIVIDGVDDTSFMNIKNKDKVDESDISSKKLDNIIINDKINFLERSYHSEHFWNKYIINVTE